jgi:hypothetical protein
VTLVLRLVRQSRWDWPANPPWLETGHIPADPLADFAGTVDNRLSVWRIEDDQSNLRRVIVAMAANRDKLDKLDYVLFPLDHLARVGVKLEETQGDTPDEEANAFHSDLVELSAQDVVRLTSLVFRDHVELGRVDKSDLADWIVEAVRMGWISVQRLNRKLRMTMQELIEPETD